MNKDMCVACDDGILNIRVGAIIMNIKMYPEFFKTELKDPTDTVSGSSRARVLEPQAGHKIQCSLFEFMVHLALH